MTNLTATIPVPIAGDGTALGVPDMIHLVPAGTFTGRDGRGPWRLADPTGVIEASRRSAGRRQIPVDYDHQIDHAPKNGGKATAAGWLTALTARPDGIWARVEWTATAAAHIAAREYRYLSPVFRHTADGTVTAILRAALTNDPNLDQLTALASRSPAMSNDPTAFLAELAALLGLAEDAREADVLVAVRAALSTRNAAAPDPSAFVPIGDFERAVSEVNRLNKGISKQAASDHVRQQIRSGNMPPMLLDWGVALCTVNRPAFDAFVERTAGVFNRLVTPRDDLARASGTVRRGALSAEELAVCNRMGLSEVDFLEARTFVETARD